MMKSSVVKITLKHMKIHVKIILSFDPNINWRKIDGNRRETKGERIPKMYNVMQAAVD